MMTSTDTMTIQVFPTTDHPAKLANVELVFGDGPLAGLKLVGFTVWLRPKGRHNVTFPARTYAINGERRSFALLRPQDGSPDADDALRDAILDAYARHIQDSRK